MNVKEDIKPITYLKSRTADVLAQINLTHRPMVITQKGEPKGVIQDPMSYERMKTAIGLMKLLAASELDAQQGTLIEQGKLFSEIAATLSKKAKKRVSP